MNILLLVWIREGHRALVHGLDSRTIHLLLSLESLMYRSCVGIERLCVTISREDWLTDRWSRLEMGSGRDRLKREVDSKAFEVEATFFQV